MIVAGFINGKIIEQYEYIAGFFISVGMVVFAAADFQVLPNANFFG
jgi:hypothetical protein